MNSYFTSLSHENVITALVGKDRIAFAQDEDVVLLPLELGVEIAAETLRMVLDEDELRNHRGDALAAYLGQADEEELRRILSRIGGPDRPTFANC